MKSPFKETKNRIGKKLTKQRNQYKSLRFSSGRRNKRKVSQEIFTFQSFESPTVNPQKRNSREDKRLETNVNSGEKRIMRQT